MLVMELKDKSKPDCVLLNQAESMVVKALYERSTVDEPDVSLALGPFSFPAVSAMLEILLLLRINCPPYFVDILNHPPSIDENSFDDRLSVNESALENDNVQAPTTLLIEF